MMEGVMEENVDKMVTVNVEGREQHLDALVLEFGDRFGLNDAIERLRKVGKSE
jgi:hypothetical protein